MQLTAFLLSPIPNIMLCIFFFISNRIASTKQKEGIQERQTKQNIQIKKPDQPKQENNQPNLSPNRTPLEHNILL